MNQIYIFAGVYFTLAMSKTVSPIHDDFMATWTSKAETFPEASLFDLDIYLRDSFDAANCHAIRLIPEHIFLLSQATSCLILLTKFVGEQKMNTHCAAFLSQAHRSANCLIAIRLLLTNGLEETCRSVTRNFLESMDISMACLVNREFAARFFGDDHIEFDSLWKSDIAYGKIYEHLRIAGKWAGVSDDEIEVHIQNRKIHKTVLSSSVHGDNAGALRSMIPPLLGYPELISREPHGVISMHTADHIAFVVSETLKYISWILKILLSEDAPHEFDLPCEGANMQTFFAHFFALQDVYYRHDLPAGDDIVAPDYSPPHS